MKNTKIGVTGHRQLPDTAIAYLSKNLSHHFTGGTGLQVVSSLAIGADTLVAEYFLGVGATLVAVIPCANYTDTFEDESAKGRYLQLLRRAERVITLPYEDPTDEAFLEAGFRVVEESNLILAVWDGEQARGLGGTADVVRHARAEHKQVLVLWPADTER